MKCLGRKGVLRIIDNTLTVNNGITLKNTESKDSVSS